MMLRSRISFAGLSAVAFLSCPEGPSSGAAPDVGLVSCAANFPGSSELVWQRIR